LNNLIIFDLDGVITSEEAYWDAAGLTLHELLYSPSYWGLYSPEEDQDEGTRAAQAPASTTPAPTEDAPTPSCRGGSGVDEESGRLRRPRPIHTPSGHPYPPKSPGREIYHPAQSAAESRHISRATLPESQILALKGRAINSNWDTCYAAVCLHLISILNAWQSDKGQLEREDAQIFPPLPWDASWLANFRQHVTGHAEQLDMARIFALPVFRDAVGLELINRLDAYASDQLGHLIEGVFSRYSPFWEFCRTIFQEWYLGDELFEQTCGHAPARAGKSGCIHFEQPLLPIEQISATLETLRQQQYTLGIATGRDFQEAAYPLRMYGLLAYFDERHISTYNAVERAEAQLRARGDQALLSKPHAFPFLYALDHSYEEAVIQGNSTQPTEPCIVIGDSTSDMLGGRAADALTVAVLTGTRTAEARQLLAQSQPDFTIDDITHLPELLSHIDSLLTIQHMQFQEREKAERLLRLWFARHMRLSTQWVSLTPKAVSLNSFNGIYRSDEQDYFFKTHVEDQGILEEYYHAALLQKAGYTIVNPLRLVHEKEQQMVIYPVVKWPVMFDLMREIETGQTSNATLDMLVSAERGECERMLAIYRATLAPVTAEQHAQAPIHQLFWHRLAGSRLNSFYAGKSVPLPGNGNNTDEQQNIAFDDMLRYRWIIQGNEQPFTLGELIERGKTALHPAQATMTVIGHGDAHFGNVFLENQRDYLYFDPAFAGKHSPLLDVIKPLYHNVYATWMYFPQEIARDLHLTVTVRDMTIIVEHDYTLAPVRQAIVATKLKYLLKPLLTELSERHALPVNWQEIMQLALMCCPLLTINLLDETRYPPAITWLGLAHAVQMGNCGPGDWRTIS
jgi:phosphoglycolate phosphatase-like HAD superfamily hydrolase